MFSEWAELLKDQPERLEIPVEPKLCKCAESAVKSMGYKLEDAVFAFLLKLAAGDVYALNISPEDFANARLLRELDEGKRSGEQKGWASDDSVREHIHGLSQDDNF